MWIAFAIPSVLGAAVALGLPRKTWRSYHTWLQFLMIALAGCLGVAILNVRWLQFAAEAMSRVLRSEAAGYGIYIATVGGMSALLTVTLGRLVAHRRNSAERPGTSLTD